MPKKYLAPINLNLNEIQNGVFQRLASAPSTPVAAQFFYNTTLNQFGVWNTSAWSYLGGGGGTVTSASVATANGFAGTVQNPTTTPAISITTSVSGVLKGDGTAISAAVPGTDFVTDLSTNTLTNKTFNAAGTGNALSNVVTSNFATGVIDNDNTLAANSATRLPTQAAVRGFVTAQVTGLGTPRAGLDCSTNPNYPASTIGDFFRVTAAGLIGGASGVAVTVGDTIQCYVTNAGGTQAAVGGNFTIVQSNVDQATTLILGLTTYATTAEAEAKAILNKAVLPGNLTNFPIKRTFTIGDNILTSIVCTHNLGTDDIVYSIREVSGNGFVDCSVVSTSASETTFTFGVAPGVNALRVVIMG